VFLYWIVKANAAAQSKGSKLRHITPMVRTAARAESSNLRVFIVLAPIDLMTLYRMIRMGGIVAIVQHIQVILRAVSIRG
jgi:hypothetical protein